MSKQEFFTYSVARLSRGFDLVITHNAQAMFSNVTGALENAPYAKDVGNHRLLMFVFPR